MTWTTTASWPDDSWAQWMRRIGARVRRVREFLGLSQEQLACVAGVSQGAVSRLEAARGLATPLLVVVKIHLALTRCLRELDPSLLSDELRRMLDAEILMSPPSGEAGRDAGPVTSDPGLEQLVRLYRGLPEQKRATLLTLVQATAEALRTG